ncbi:hypothetical protein L6R52_08140 [Myxococcota bacterium]|nr:hypothetical protein [Myxococcota bacterium]
MRARRRPEEQGFALIVVVMIVAAISLVAVTLLNFVNLDIILTGQARRTIEARTIADGAAYEIYDRDDLGDFLPDMRSNALQTVLSDPRNMFGGGVQAIPGGSQFIDPNGTADRPPTTFTADIRFLRYGPIVNTGLNTARGLYYEIRTIGEVNNGESTSEVRVEVRNMQAFSAGDLLTPRHAR